VSHKSKDPNDQGDKPVRVLFVDTTSIQPDSCAIFKQTHLIRLQLRGQVQTGVEYDVQILGLTDVNGSTLIAKTNPVSIPGVKPGTMTNSFDPSMNRLTMSVTAQSVLNEALTDGSYKGVDQVALNSTTVLHKAPGKGAAFYANTKDLFSSNERDKKSAFLGGVGYEWGPQGWYAPLKLEGDVQGNQVATNLSTLANLSVDTVFPWGWSSHVLNNLLFDLPLSPDLTIALPYTHRINQIVGKSGPLPVNDFAVNPALALKNGVLFPNKYCSPNMLSAKQLLCFGLEADAGMYYLPLQTTTKGSQRAEGYGDVSFLIPLSNFSHFPFLTLDTSSLASQIRIEYADVVNPANNYARTAKWSFGLELIGKK
jgi:hypothetical protein